MRARDAPFSSHAAAAAGGSLNRGERQDEARPPVHLGQGTCASKPGAICVRACVHGLHSVTSGAWSDGLDPLRKSRAIAHERSVPARAALSSA